MSKLYRKNLDLNNIIKSKKLKKNLKNLNIKQKNI